MVRLDGPIDVLPELHLCVSSPDLHYVGIVRDRVLINAVDEYY